jgi:hypothetical protein
MRPRTKMEGGREREREQNEGMEGKRAGGGAGDGPGTLAKTHRSLQVHLNWG